MYFKNVDSLKKYLSEVGQSHLDDAPLCCRCRNPLKIIEESFCIGCIREMSVKWRGRMFISSFIFEVKNANGSFKIGCSVVSSLN